MLTDGAAGDTVTLAAVDVAVMPAESVTWAVRATLPTAEGVHDTV